MLIRRVSLRDADGKVIVHGTFSAVPYCIDLIEGPYLETDERFVKAHRPAHAKRRDAAVP